MFRFWGLRLAWLFFGCITNLLEPFMEANAASVNHGNRNNCMYDNHKAKAKNHSNLRAELPRCGEKPFNPAAPTCCTVEDGDTTEEGLSHGVSSCCGLKAYNPLREICCETTVVAKPGPNAQCCGKEAFDANKQLCCGPNGSEKILTRESSHHRCCGQDQYNSKTQCCCWINEALQICLINSSCCIKESVCCGTKAYDPLKEICCQSTVVAKPSPNAKCCGNEAFDADKQMCCGPNGSQVILTRESSHHQCCGHDRYDSRTQCCCWISDALQIHLINSSCCVKESALCEAKPYDPLKELCCQSTVVDKRAPNATCCGNEAFDADKQMCCGPNGSEKILTRESSHHRCCGQDQYNSKTQCCCWINEALQIHLINSSCCLEKSGVQQQFHGSPGHHCCGTEVDRSHTEICCNGHRHPKVENTHCCGVQAYSTKNQQMKCCAGTLYNLSLLGTLGHEARCCGSVLQKTQDVCCKSPLHQPGHHRNNMIKESRLQSVNNLNKTDLCKEMLVGTVEMMSLHHIVFNNVVKIHGRKGSVNPDASTRTLNITDRCNAPKVFPGKTYSFDEVNIFIDFNHDSILQSIHFIMSKCYHF